MRLNKANFAGLTSPLQHAEMKSILAGAWPPLKPLPVFKYETVEYRATIDFDRKRGEWVCRRISLPSNEVQELRGGLREITMALPHGEDETFTEGAEQLEQELEKDTSRRLQAIHEWKENHKNGALYFELRDYLSESQRTEIDDSLRLSLTARQLQFNPKNIAHVFDDLSVAGGRFAALIEFAKRNKAKQGTDPQARGEVAVPEAEHAIDHDKQSLGISFSEFEPALDNPSVRDQEAAVPEAEHTIDLGKQSPGISSPEFGPILDSAFIRDHKAAECCTEADEPPAVSIKNVFPVQHEASSAEQMAPHSVAHQFEIEIPEILDADAPSLVEHPCEEEDYSPSIASLAGHVPTDQPSADPIEGASLRFPGLEISAFQVAVIALLFLSAVIAFTAGLRLGRGSLARRLQEAQKSMAAVDAKPAVTLPDQTYESIPQTPTPPVASSNASAGTYGPDDSMSSEEKPKENTGHKLDDSTPSEPSGEKSMENARGSEYLPQTRSTDSDSAPTTESKLSAKPEVNSEHTGVIEPIAPESPGPHRVSPRIAAKPRLPGSSPILVTLRGQGGQPFRVSFPEKAIGATSSVAMASQLSVLVSSEPGATVARQSARLEAGKLVSFVWPRYARPRHGLAETIRVRATIGQLGQVQDVKLLSGSTSLLPATIRAVRQWRYQPTQLDKRPVQAQQDVTIEFRPPQYSSRVSTHHPSHN